MPMQSRTDQVHSYQFFLQRVVSGLVAKESDPAELPFRRLGWSGFGSIMVAVLVTAGFGIYGIFVGGGATSWRDGGSVIVEKETGATFIFRDDRLHPMVNLASARLALAGAGTGGFADVARVSARSLAGVPRGATLGISGAPEGLPDDGDLVTGGWALCSERVPNGRGGREVRSVLGVGRAPDGAGQLAEDRAVLVRDVAAEPDQDLHLVWHGHRFALTRVEPALQALGASPERAVPVAPGWLDALPVGDELEPPSTEADRGEPTRALADLRADREILVGQVVESAGRFFLVRSTELREVTPLERDIVLADPDTRTAYPDGTPDVVQMPPAVMANAERIEPLPERTIASAPETRPELASMAPQEVQDGAVCAAFHSGRFTPEIQAGARLPRQGAVATPQQTAAGLLLADHVLVAGGSAALVQAVPSPDAPTGSLAGGSLHLVTDQGIRYSLPGPEVAAALGYGTLDNLVQLPAALVARLPEGPALDPAAAILPPAAPAPAGPGGNQGG